MFRGLLQRATVFGVGLLSASGNFRLVRRSQDSWVQDQVGDSFPDIRLQAVSCKLPAGALVRPAMAISSPAGPVLAIGAGTVELADEARATLSAREKPREGVLAGRPPADGPPVERKPLLSALKSVSANDGRRADVDMLFGRPEDCLGSTQPPALIVKNPATVVRCKNSCNGRARYPELADDLPDT